MRQAIFKKNIHPFHMVTKSIWPFLISITFLNIIISLMPLLNVAEGSHLFKFFKFHGIYMNIAILVFLIGRWFRDIILEATFEGRHTTAVQGGLILGFLLFLISEIMFFFSFFWAFFHNALSPSIFIGSIWPPLYFKQIDVLGLPLLNTVLLLMSGITITYSHRALLTRNKSLATDGLIWTLFFGILFIICQLHEYRYSYFSMNDGIYGSIFYILTGFHGLHVIIGCCFLSIALIRLINFHFTSTHHVGYEISVLYWHMVDIVWLFLFIFVYLWGNGEYILDNFFVPLEEEVNNL